MNKLIAICVIAMFMEGCNVIPSSQVASAISESSLTDSSISEEIIVPSPGTMPDDELIPLNFWGDADVYKVFENYLGVDDLSKITYGMVRSYSNPLSLSVYSIPPIIGEFQSVTDLYINGSGKLGAYDLPESIYGLCSLKKLAIRQVGITELSPNIKNLINLEYLDLYVNRLASLPAELWKLPNLRHLDLQYNPIILSDEIIQSNIRILNLAHTSIDYNHKTIENNGEMLLLLGKMPFLERLDYSYNNLKTIPSNLFDGPNVFPSLVGLDLGRNEIQSISNLIAEFPKLRVLKLDCNPLFELELHPTKKVNLIRLSLKNDYMGESQTYPFLFELHQIGSIEQLDLEGCLLTELPGEVGIIPNLEALNLLTNNLYSLPESIAIINLLYIDEDLKEQLPRPFYDGNNELIPAIQKQEDAFSDENLFNKDPLDN